MAEVNRRKGLYVESLISLEQARTRLEGVDEPLEKAFNLRILADVQRARGQLEDAVQAILTAIPIYQQREEFDELAWARSALADIYSVQGRFGEALQVVEQGLQDFSSGGINLATMNLSYADFLINVGEYEAAQQKLSAALELATDSKLEEQPQFAYALGRIKSANQDRTASTYLSSASDQASRNGDLLLSGRASIALAEVLIAEGKVQDGRQLLSRTLESARKIRNLDVQAYAAVVLAETELSAGRLAESEALSFEAKDLAVDFQGKPILRRIQENLLGSPGFGATRTLSTESTARLLRSTIGCRSKSLVSTRTGMRGVE